MFKIVIGAGRFDPKIHKTEVARWPGGEDTLVASKVLTWTILKHSPAARNGEIEIINTYSLGKPQLKRERNPTPFSLVRFWVPQLCGREGMAAYFDADMVVFDDVSNLFAAATGDHRVWQANRESVLVYDCAKLGEWDAFKFRDLIDSGQLSYKNFMTTLNGEKNVGRLPVEWNCLDSHTPGKTKLLHYTNLSSQPWRKGSPHPHQGLWWGLL